MRICIIQINRKVSFAMKTCFVIMGYGVKKGLDLDLTYNEIIKPCIEQIGLIPFPLYDDNKYNAYRCDEISGTTTIDYNFVSCLNGADIVIADISTMNINALYELGARHALKSKITILLCAKEKEQEFKFFDLSYVPIVFYEHDGNRLDPQQVENTRKELSRRIDCAIHDSSTVSDNPICRVLNEIQFYSKRKNADHQSTIYQLYQQGRRALDDNSFEEAEKILSELYNKDSSEENLLLLTLAKYKIAEKNNSCKALIDCICLITEKIDIKNSTSEYLFGRLAAICLRVFNMSDSKEYYYQALEYYKRGSDFSKGKLYCPRNYCALLFRIYELTDDTNVIKEYFYTAKHFAKVYLKNQKSIGVSEKYEEQIYHKYNVADLTAIVNDGYSDYEKIISYIRSDPDISARQRTTILDGIERLKKDIDRMSTILKEV